MFKQSFAMYFCCATFMKRTALIVALVFTVLCGASNTRANTGAGLGPWGTVTLQQAKAQAQTLLRAGKNSEAFTLYMSLLWEAPEDSEVNLGLSQAATAVGEHNQAVLALERLVDDYPTDAGLRMELARAHLRTGNDEAARREFEFAKSIDPSLTDDIAERVLAQLEKQFSRWEVSGRLSFGLTYDTNVNQGPNSAFVQLGYWPLQLGEAATSKKSMGAYGMASLEAAWRAGPESPWWVVGDVGLYRKGNFSDLETSRELGWGRAAMGVRRTGSNSLFDLRVKTDAADYISDNQVAFSNGLELLYVWASSPRVQWITRASLERRDYESLTGRQGWYTSAGEHVRFIFGENNHDVTVGGRYIYADAARNDYGYTGWEGSLRTTFNLPYSVSLSPFVTYREDYYNGPGTALEFEKRQDSSWRTGLAVSHALTPVISLDLSWQYTDNASTSPVYVYDQHIITAGMSWKF